jgi:multiple sugar transport system substrate-binding protein
MERSEETTISRRRFLQALAAVGVATACGPAAPTGASPAPSTAASATVAAAKPVSIEWWRRNYTAGTQNAETLTSDGAVKAFREKNPNFTISIQGGPFGPETDQKFDIAILQQKAGPDVFHTTGGDVLKYAAAGQLSEPPLTAAEKADFNTSALTATTYKGKVVAYPLWIVPWFEYINLDLFKERGVTPPADGNWTYDQFLDAAKKLTFKRADGKQIYGFAHANDEFAFMLIDGGRLYDTDVKKWTFNSAEAISGLEKWIALAREKVMPPDYLTLNPNDSQARFIAGEIAILQRPSAMINVLNADARWKYGTNWEIANFPKGATAQTAWGGVGFIAVREQADADKKAAAHAFAKYLTGPDIGPDLKKMTPPVEYWLAPAARTSAAGIYGEYHAAKAKVAKMGSFTYVLPNVSTWAEIDQKYLRPARDAALEGKKTAKQALDEVAPTAQRLLDEANK